MISFSYTNPNDGEKRSLDLRIDPYNIEWTYNINTQIYDTYGGQVIQVLSVNIDNLIIDGQIGREGPFGIHPNKEKHHVKDPRWSSPGPQGGSIPPGGFITNDVSRQWNANSSPDHIGLYQLADFFANYFTVSSQGGLPHNPGKFIQIPMTITYDSGPYPSASADAGAPSQTTFRHWQAFPTSFPAFSRSNKEFAPLWKIEFSVYQADPNIEFATKNDAIKSLSRIRDGVGWEAQNPWVDPAANPKDPPALVLKKLVSEYKNFLPKITEGELAQMIWQGISLPAVEAGLPQNTVFETFGVPHPAKPKSKSK